MRPIHMFGAALLAALTLTACGDDDYGNPTTPVPPPPPSLNPVIGAGDLTATLAGFRAALGEPRNGGAVGPADSGRREINWDGVPAEFDNVDNKFPAAFFNTNVRLGAVFSTTGTGFRNDTSKFGDLAATLRDQFAPFSPAKLFSPSNANVVDVHFQLAGQPTPALVAGFGAVFVDVDLAGRTTLEAFDRDGKSLGIVTVPVRTAASPFSFGGFRLTDAKVARVRITLGTGALGAGVNDISSGGASDLVVLDDFLYTEPQPVR